MKAPAKTFGSPSGGAEHYHWIDASTNVRKTLDTTRLRLTHPIPTTFRIGFTLRISRLIVSSAPFAVPRENLNWPRSNPQEAKE
jgi:hypothetical protein